MDLMETVRGWWVKAGGACIWKRADDSRLVFVDVSWLELTFGGQSTEAGGYLWTEAGPKRKRMESKL